MLLGFMALPTGGPTNKFYESWADYLQPYPTIFLKAAAISGHWLATLFYNLGSAVLEAWNSAWKLAKFSSLFTSRKHDVMTGFDLTQYIGTFFKIGLIILSLMMAIQLIQFTMTSGRRGKEWPAGVVTSLIIIWVVPLLITSGLAIGKAANKEMLGDSQQQNVLTKIWRSNTVDLKKLAEANFDVSGDNPNKFSPITDKSSNEAVKSTVFTQIMDDDQVKNVKGDHTKDVFAYKLGDSDKEKLDKGSFMTGSAAAEVYPRVKTNWFGIIAAEIVFAIVGFLSIIELLLRFYRLAYYSITLLIFAFRDMEGKKAMQILHVMEGSIIGIALLPLNLLLFFGFIQWGITTVGELNLGWAPYTILIIALMCAGMKGLLGGFALVDDWTGVPTGGGQSMMGMIGAASTTASVGRGVVGAGRTVGNGIRSTANVAKSTTANLQDKLAKVGDKAAEAREGAFDSLNESGKLPNVPMAANTKGAELDSAVETGSETGSNSLNNPNALGDDTKPDEHGGTMPMSGVESQGNTPEAQQTVSNGFAGFSGPNGEPAHPVESASRGGDDAMRSEATQGIPTSSSSNTESETSRNDAGFKPTPKSGTIDVPLNNPKLNPSGTSKPGSAQNIAQANPRPGVLYSEKIGSDSSIGVSKNVPNMDATNSGSNVATTSQGTLSIPNTSDSTRRGTGETGHSVGVQMDKLNEPQTQGSQVTLPNETTRPVLEPQTLSGNQSVNLQSPNPEMTSREYSTAPQTTEPQPQPQPQSEVTKPTESSPKSWRDMSQQERHDVEYQELKEASHVGMPSHWTKSVKNGRDQSESD